MIAASHGSCAPPQIITSMPAEDPERLLLVASTRLPQRDGSPQRFKLLISRLDIPDFAGPGGSANPHQTGASSLFCLWTANQTVEHAQALRRSNTPQ